MGRRVKGASRCEQMRADASRCEELRAAASLNSRRAGCGVWKVLKYNYKKPEGARCCGAHGAAGHTGQSQDTACPCKQGEDLVSLSCQGSLWSSLITVRVSLGEKK